MVRGIWRRQGDYAVPVDAEVEGHFRKIKDGDEFFAETKRATKRKIKQLRMLWAVVRLIADATDKEPEVVKRSIAIRLGFCHAEVDMDGTERVVADSIAVDNMEQDVFDQFFKSALRLAEEWLGASSEDVQRRFIEITADRRYEGYRR
mgnify:CR=1 FL=1